MGTWFRHVGSIALLAALALGGTAWGDTFNWTFQQIDPTYGGPDVALALRTGATWPTAFHDQSQTLPYTVVASSLTPVGWVASGLGPFAGSRSYVRAISGSDGRVGAVFMSNDQIRFAQSTAGGWSTAVLATVPANPVSAPSLGYLSGNHPAVAYTQNNHLRLTAHNGANWETENITVTIPGYSPDDYGNSASLAVDSLSRPSVAYLRGADLNFALRNPVTGTWQGMRVASNVNNLLHLSLAYGPNDVPGLTMLMTDHRLYYSSYDVQSGSWLTQLIDDNVTSQRVNLAFDSQGHAAVSYVTDEERLAYTVHRDAGWATSLLPNGIDPSGSFSLDPRYETDAALAFDAHDIPLIAYHSQSGLLLAYDPTLPEPASAALILALLVLARRGRSL